MTEDCCRVAVIPGDGIGPEVVSEALKVVAAAGVTLETEHYELGAARYLRDGFVMSDDLMSELSGFDAVLLGAIGPPVDSTAVPAGVLERGLLLRLRFDLDLYVNLRPFDGAPGSIAEGASFKVVRENTEGPYAGEGGVLRRGRPGEIATQGSVNTRMGVERCVRFAFDLAEDSPRRRVTLVHKTNVLTFAGDLWRRVFEEVGLEHPGVETSYQHVDAACIHMVERAASYGVIVTDNLFGDILTDLAGALCGGIGLAASANLNPAMTGPSLFEPVHGAAHDIAGKGVANPLAAIRSAAMMLDFLEEGEAASHIERAVLDVQAGIAGRKDRWSTAEIGDAVVGRL